MATRPHSLFDQIIGRLDDALRQAAAVQTPASRPSPAETMPPAALSQPERQLSGRLMRVNHTGEICAQALYQGQALTARTPAIQQKLENAAREESDHLAWCAQRLSALEARPSYLNLLWFAGSYTIGAVAGAAGDKWNLGFLAETERQVVRHLDRHLARLPEADEASRAVVTLMRADEDRHATTAFEAGGAPLPTGVRLLMRLASRVMTETAYWV